MQPLIMSGSGPVATCPAPSPPAPQPATSALQLAEQASSKQPWPNLVVSINPGTGLTGLASWFWLGGGSPSMPNATASAGALSVTVRATFVDVIWDFGDGSGYDSGTDIGQPYPAHSDVQHVYQADTYQMPQGYTLTVTLRYRVDYSVNGGPWTELGIKAKSYSRSYSVNQLQPEAVSAQ